MGCVEVLDDLTAEGLGDNHTVLIQEDAVLGVHGVADGPKAAAISADSARSGALSAPREALSV